MPEIPLLQLLFDEAEQRMLTVSEMNAEVLERQFASISPRLKIRAKRENTFVTVNSAAAATDR